MGDGNIRLWGKSVLSPLQILSFTNRLKARENLKERENLWIFLQVTSHSRETAIMGPPDMTYFIGGPHNQPSPTLDPSHASNKKSPLVNV